jgi:hypothetical protein
MALTDLQSLLIYAYFFSLPMTAQGTMSTTSLLLLAMASIDLSFAIPTTHGNPSSQNASSIHSIEARSGGPNSFASGAWSKRGIGFDFWEDGDKWTNTFTGNLQGNKISWGYSWDSAPSPKWPNGDNFNRGLNFVPMLWCPGNKWPEHTEKWARNMEQMIQAGAKELLTFNEPDMCADGAGGSCYNNANDAAQRYAQYTDPFRNRGLRFGSPAVTSEMRYGNMGLPWLRSFLDNCRNCQIDFIPIHWYGHANEAGAFLNHINDAAGVAGGRKLWITEFGFNGGSAEEQVNFMRQVLPQLDRDARVERYAFHKANKPQMFNNDGSLSLVGYNYAII